MATTIQNATLTVVVTETLSLGGTQYGGTKTLEISSINEVFKRIVKCAASQTTTIATFNGNAFASDNAIDLEAEVHEYLSSYRVKNNREFFKLTLEEARTAIEKLGLKYNE